MGPGTDSGGTTALFNDGSGANTGGFYGSSDGKAFTYETGTSGVISAGNYSTLWAVPGQTGHFYMSAAPDPHSTSWPQSGSTIVRSTGGCGGTWSTLANVESVFGFGFGAAMSGSDGYPTFYCVCWVNTGGGYAYGTWRAKNIDTGSPIWTQLELRRLALVLEVPTAQATQMETSTGSGWCRAT